MKHRLDSYADKLVRLYAPRARLVVRWRGVSRVRNEDGQLTISWNPSDGYQGLLHEIAHIRHRHTVGLRLDAGEAFGGEQVMQEVKAWLWTEHRMRRLGLPFDYASAERDLATYCRDVRVVWRARERPSRGPSAPA